METANRYCGAKAPDVVLHVDHIIPVAQGGHYEEDNLITSCQDCNRGKYTRRLDAPTTPLDVNQKCLEIEEKIAHTKRLREALKHYMEEWQALNDEREAVALYLVRLWCKTINPREAPGLSSIEDLLTKIGPEEVEDLFHAVARKHRRTFVGQWSAVWDVYWQKQRKKGSQVASGPIR